MCLAFRGQMTVWRSTQEEEVKINPIVSDIWLKQASLERYSNAPWVKSYPEASIIARLVSVVIDLALRLVERDLVCLLFPLLVPFPPG
jgi:hypothetical protein